MLLKSTVPELGQHSTPGEVGLLLNSLRRITVRSIVYPTNETTFDILLSVGLAAYVWPDAKILEGTFKPGRRHRVGELLMGLGEGLLPEIGMFNGPSGCVFSQLLEGVGLRKITNIVFPWVDLFGEYQERNHMLLAGAKDGLDNISLAAGFPGGELMGNYWGRIHGTPAESYLLRSVGGWVFEKINEHLNKRLFTGDSTGGIDWVWIEIGGTAMEARRALAHPNSNVDIVVFKDLEDNQEKAWVTHEFATVVLGVSKSDTSPIMVMPESGLHPIDHLINQNTQTT